MKKVVIAGLLNFCIFALVRGESNSCIADLDARYEKAIRSCSPEESPALGQYYKKVRRDLEMIEGFISHPDIPYDTMISALTEFKRSRATCLLTSAMRQQVDDAISWMRSEKRLPIEDRGKSAVPWQKSDPIPAEKLLSRRIEEISRILKPGDLVFRRDCGSWSECFANASTKEKRFSHVGIVVRSGGGVAFVHSGGAELTGRLAVETVDSSDFFANVVDAAVYRWDGNSPLIARAAEKRIGTPFDPAFDLKTKDRLYCTEMVRDCVNEAAGREVIGTSRKGDFEYVAVDDCYRNEMTKVWDCRDQEPEEQSPVQKLQSRPVVIETAPTANAPVRRTIRFIPKNR